MPPTGVSVVNATRAFPKLYNAHRQIEVSRGLLPLQLDHFKKNPLSESWRTQVSQDVVDFVDQIEKHDEKGVPTNELLPQEKAKLFRSPSTYFSRPHNVPVSAREQIHFPSFSVIFIRTPHLGPRYAQFKVPLWFGKLDMKSYLKSLYNVDVNHVRSYVIHQKQSRKDAQNRYSRGQRYQPRFRKRMTVELVEPFIWPEELTEKQLNDRDYQKDKFWESQIDGIDAAKRDQAEFVAKPDEKHRRTLAQQAKDLLAGKAVWKPTWQQLPQDVRVLQGRLKTGSSQSSTNFPSALR